MTPAIRSLITGEHPVFLLIAGPNGAGKSTYSDHSVEQTGIALINPDKFARRQFGRDPNSLAEALKVSIDATEEAKRLIDLGQSVALETVFSDTQGHKLSLLRHAKARGHKVVVVFVALSSVGLCQKRVRERADEGGHNVPLDKVAERYPRCFANLAAAIPIVDAVVVYDHSEGEYHMVATFESGEVVETDVELATAYSHCPEFHALLTRDGSAA